MESTIWVGNAVGRLELQYYGYIEPGAQVQYFFDGNHALTLHGKYLGYTNTTVYIPSGTKYVNIKLICPSPEPNVTKFLFYSRILGVTPR